MIMNLQIPGVHTVSIWTNADATDYSLTSIVDIHIVEFNSVKLVCNHLRYLALPLRKLYHSLDNNVKMLHNTPTL